MLVGLSGHLLPLESISAAHAATQADGNEGIAANREPAATGKHLGEGLSRRLLPPGLPRFLVGS